MNPRLAGDFLKSKFGLFIVFVVVLFSGLWIYGHRQAEQKEAARLAAQNSKKVELGQVKVPLDQGLESGVPQAARPPSMNPGVTGDTSGIVPFRPPVASTKVVVAPAQGPAPAPAEVKPKKIRHASLLATYEAPPAAPPPPPAPPERFMPFGTLLKCKLVNTLDSSNQQTPVIAVLLEDVWQNGKKIIPANTLVHGTASAGRIRDRMIASGTWRFVWQDGRELAFSGIALDREYEHDIDGYGITDGSAGMKGRVLAADNLQELKLLAAAALSGFARGTQDRTQTVLGTTITGSISSGVREGAADVFELYAQRVLRDIEENGYYVRVAAGKEFYVYVLEAIDPAKANVAGTRHQAATGAEPAAQSPNPNQG
ncbi:hypothetical protein OPIT5_06170 [Opitutaceae bacterium TAV5]|nr:hypothetical protein OPIT5_06170 [Opitutaceae bacterium TAV5]